MLSRFIAVCGPTASGKSAVSVALAKKLNAEILNFDASQVFIGADIATAKISNAEMRGVKHHLLDLVSIDQKIQAGFFIEKAELTLASLYSKNVQPLICVGTTMFLALLMEGIADTGEGNPEYRKNLEQEESAELYQMLQDKDPERALALHPNDRMRVIRALEILHVSGKSASSLYAEQAKHKNRSGLLIILCWDREKLAKRIEARVDTMFEAGLLKECRTLLEKFDIDSQIFSSIGYSETLKFLRKEISETELRDEISLHTKQLAKRQMTFLRRFPLKHGFKCYPEQTLEHNTTSAKKPKKGPQLDFKVERLSLPQLLQECVKYLENEPEVSNLKALYVDADYLLQTLAVS